ncbi:hypothetical protein LRE75_05070 [Streptomyces sp. 372A]
MTKVVGAIAVGLRAWSAAQGRRRKWLVSHAVSVEHCGLQFLRGEDQFQMRAVHAGALTSMPAAVMRRPM